MPSKCHFDPCIIRNASILSGLDLECVQGLDLVISSGVITALETQVDQSIPNASIVDASGYLILPGFINPCIHLSSKIHMESILRKSLALGVTTVGLLAHDSESMKDNQNLDLYDLIECTMLNQTGSCIARPDGTLLWNQSEYDNTWIDSQDSSRLIHMGLFSHSASTKRDQNGIDTADTLNIYATGDPSVHSINIWRYLKSVCRKNGVFNQDTLREGLKRVSVEAAKSLRLSNRGSIQVGNDADLIFMRLDAFGDLNTLEGFFAQLFITESESEAIDAVMKRGQIIYNQNTSRFPQVPLFNAPYFPSSSERLDICFDTIESAIQDFRAFLMVFTHTGEGKFVLIVDNEDRENEGDLVIAAEDMTPEKAAFMIRYTSGVLCAPALASRLEELKLPLMVERNTDSLKTAYTITVDHKDTTTGISAADRALTLRSLASPQSTHSDFNRPGHVFPLMYTPGGVLKRTGHTEASIDFCLLSGKQPVAAISEVTLDNGHMARRNDLMPFAKTWGIKIVTISDLVAFRLKHGFLNL